MNRRELLLLRTGRDHVAELCCERLYMRYVDAEVDGTTTRLFDGLAHDLQNTSSVRLTETAWLAREDLKARLDVVLAAFAARGGRVVR